MLKNICVLIAITTNTAFAAELSVLNLSADKIRAGDSIHSAFRTDLQSGAGIAQVVVQRINHVHSPGGYGESVNIETVLERRATVPGLSVVNDQLVFKNEEETVLCARIVKTRILRRTKLILTGLCELEAQVANVNGTKRLIVKFFTDEE